MRLKSPLYKIANTVEPLVVACEAQTYFQSLHLSLRKLTIFGGRDATTGNTSALRRLLNLHQQPPLERLLKKWYVTFGAHDLYFLCHTLTFDPVNKILKKHKDFQSAKVAENRPVFLTLYLREPSQLSVTHFKGTKGILLYNKKI